MYLDNHLSLDQHIHKLGTTLSRPNGILSKLRYNSSRNVCLYTFLCLIPCTCPHTGHLIHTDFTITIILSPKETIRLIRREIRSHRVRSWSISHSWWKRLKFTMWSIYNSMWMWHIIWYNPRWTPSYLFHFKEVRINRWATLQC